MRVHLTARKPRTFWVCAARGASGDLAPCVMAAFCGGECGGVGHRLDLCRSRSRVRVRSAANTKRGTATLPRVRPHGGGVRAAAARSRLMPRRQRLRAAPHARLDNVRIVRVPSLLALRARMHRRWRACASSHARWRTCALSRASSAEHGYAP